MRREWGAVLLVVGLSVGSLYGRHISPPEQGPVRVVEREVEVTVEKTKEVTVEKPVVPASCIEANDLAKHLLVLVDEYEGALGQQTQLLDSSFAAINSKSTPELNRVIERQRALKSDLLNPLLEIVKVRKKLNAASTECNAAVR